MHLDYYGKMDEQKIWDNIEPCVLEHVCGFQDNKSKLIKGDNLRIMRYLIEQTNLKEKIDLVYIDPPFSTKNIFRMSKQKANTISRSNSDSIAYADSLIGPEYLEFLRERLILIKKLLSKNGSIYVHIDFKIGHYVKIIMDEVFGRENFINDITRIKCNPKNFKRKAYSNIKDLILFYSKTNEYIWHEPKKELSEEEIERLFKKMDKNGRRYTTIPVHAPGETANGPTGQMWRGIFPPKGRHWRSNPSVLEELDKEGLIEWSKNNVPRKIIYADEKDGKRVQDIWEFKDPQYPKYPTEKNLDLLKLIINTSSNKNSIVLDCFCGSGTTLKAAQDLGRTWIGIDKSDEAIKTSIEKLSKKQKKSGENAQYEYLVQKNILKPFH